MKKVLRLLALFSVLLGVLVFPAASFACNDSTSCPAAPSCPTEVTCPSGPIPLAPACPTSCTESVTFTNDTACAQHIKIHYRTGLFSTHHVHVDLAPGSSYTFTYKTDSIWSKWAKVTDHSYRKVQSGYQYFVSGLL